MRLDIRLADLDTVLAPLAAFPRDLAKAVRRAVNKAGTHLATTLARRIKPETFLSSGDIRKAFARPVVRVSDASVMAEVRVAGKKMGLEHFRLVPRRVTARKRLRSTLWPQAGYRLGPRDAVRVVMGEGNKSKGFVMRSRAGRLLFMQREGKKTLKRVLGPTVQYFASFDEVVRDVEVDVRGFFARTLSHEAAWLSGQRP